MNFLEKKLSIAEIKGIHSDVYLFDKFIDTIIKIKELSLIEYSSLGRSFASLLADYNLPQLYRKFVSKYNQTIKNTFTEDNKMVNEILKSLGVFGLMHMDSFYIKDLTDLFSNGKFKKESKLEQSLFKSLTTWSEEWVVKCQQHVGSGVSDLTIELGNDKVAIELKKGLARSKDVLQTSGYYRKNSGYKAILIAQSFDSDALRLSEELNIACYGYCLATPDSEEVPEFFILDKVNNVYFDTKVEEELKDIDFCGGHPISFFKKADFCEVFNESIHQNKKLLNNLIGILEGKSVLSPQ